MSLLTEHDEIPSIATIAERIFRLFHTTGERQYTAGYVLPCSIIGFDY